MPRNQTTNSGLTPSQALYVVDRLLRERKVNARDVSRMASEMHTEIADLERRLAFLRAGSGNDGASRRGPRAALRRQARPVNAAVAASRRLQGEYMGLIRHLAVRDRARMKKLAAEKGREAAVKEMRSQLDR